MDMMTARHRGAAATEASDRMNTSYPKLHWPRPSPSAAEPSVRLFKHRPSWRARVTAFRFARGRGGVINFITHQHRVAAQNAVDDAGPCPAHLVKKEAQGCDTLS